MILFYLLLAILPLSENQFWGVRFGTFTLFKYLGALCAIYAVVYVTTKHPPSRFLSAWQVRSFLALYALAMLSYITKDTYALDAILAYTSFVIFLFTMLYLVDSLKKLQSVILVTIGAAAFASLYVLRGAQKYGLDRPGGAAGDANYYALTMLPAIPIALCLALERGNRWVRLFCIPCILLILLGCAVASSRGGFLAVTAALLVLVWHSRKRFRNLLAAGLVLIPLSFWPGAPLQRLLHPGYGDREAVNARKIAWKAGLRMIQKHPLQGVGIGMFKPLVMRYEEPGETVSSLAHNTYIEVAAELGIPGLILFLTILGASFMAANRVRKRTVRGPRRLHLAALGVEASLVGMAVGIFYLSAEYQKPLWLLVGLSMCLSSLLRKKEARRKRLLARAATAKAGEPGPRYEPQYQY